MTIKNFVKSTTCFFQILKEESIMTEISPPLLQKDRKHSVHHSRWYLSKKYLYNFWNCLDFISYSITFAAITIRFFKSTTSNNLARRFYSLSLFTMYMRFLHVILMSRKLGPKIIMIKEMVCHYKYTKYCEHHTSLVTK